MVKASMLRKVPVSLIVLLALAYPVLPRWVSPTGEGSEAIPQPPIHSKLDGHNITLRIYPNTSGADTSFTLVDAPLTAGTVQAAAIKAAYPSISWGSLVVAWAPDQADPVTAGDLGKSIWAQSYNDFLRLSLSDLAAQREEFDPWWVMLDARGEPIPGASVTAYAYLRDKKTEIVLGQDTTDDLGRLRRWIPYGKMSFLLKVEHPNYGTAIVEYVHSEDDRAGVYWVPLVPRDSEAAASGIEGKVVDEQGHPVPGATVKCERVTRPDGGLEFQRGYASNHVITDEEGWFALCVPIFTKEGTWKPLPPAGTWYRIDIAPPSGSEPLMLFPYGPTSVQTGTRRTFILVPPNLPKFLYTFSFEYAEGPITEREDLEKITLVFIRNGFEWLRLRWQSGSSLPSGTLRAVTERWPGEEFWFEEIELTENSPRLLVFKSPAAIHYRGRVIDGATGTPMSDVLVAVGRVSERWAGPSLVDELSWQFEAQAGGELTDQGPPLLYKTYNRVVRSDAQGAYELTFMPGIAPFLGEFTAVAPGRRRASIEGSSLAPDANGIVELPAIEMPGPGSGDGLAGVVFEDENGPVADPNRLKDIMIEVRAADGRAYADRFENLATGLEFVPGTYHAEVIWHDKYYVFEPVDLSAGPPARAVFRPGSISAADVTCTGRVVHGVTGEPIAGAIVLYNRMPGGGHVSSLTAQQWAAIETLGAAPDATDPALTPLLSLLIPSTAPIVEAIPQIVRTDVEGRFSLRWRQQPFTRRADCLQAFAKDFLGAQQQLTFLASPGGDPMAEAQLCRLEPGADGVLAIQPMKLFPAATVVVHPIVADPAYAQAKHRVNVSWGFYFLVVNASHWINDLRASPRDNQGAGVYWPHTIRPNVNQSIHVPTGASPTLSLSMQSPNSLPPIRLWTGELQQGQVLDLGRVEFQPGVDVVLKVVDSNDVPLPGIRVEYRGENWLSTSGVTDAAGLMPVKLPAYSSGYFYIHYGYTSGPRPAPGSEPIVSGTVIFSYTIGGREDAGLMFILEVPDSALEHLRQAKMSPDVETQDFASLRPRLSRTIAGGKDGRGRLSYVESRMRQR